MRKNALYIVVASALMILICIIYQGTYSYFISSFESTGNSAGLDKTTTEIKDLIITDGTNVPGSSLIPGESVSHTFTVQNPNTQDLCFQLLWTNVTNTLTSKNDLIITLQKSDGTIIISESANQAFPSANEILATGLKIKGSTTDTYTLTILYKNTDQNQIADMNATFSGTITGQLTECLRNVADEIIANVDTTGACPTVNDDGTVNITDVEDTESLICSAPDDYGTSYYYRGAVENNYVYFAGYYWRILRVNGDGSIRIIYDGTSAHANNESSTDRQIGTSAYNPLRTDNAYVGYMYGTPRTSTYEETHANINNSTIKTRVDTWYEENILDTEYEQYVSDTLFCNDRSFYSSNTGTGTGTSVTYYRYATTGTGGVTLKCVQQNDRFTVNDEVLGNGDLTYPVGLLTADEVFLAGGTNSLTNYNYYLYTGNYYWTMSPYSFSNSYAYVRYVYSAGYVNSSFGVSFSYGVRPVLNLKSGSLTGGSGTATDPYTV